MLYTWASGYSCLKVFLKEEKISQWTKPTYHTSSYIVVPTWHFGHFRQAINYPQIKKQEILIALKEK